ncbi:hypothetical protein [Aurantibacillus circumpalustris]|uniref:hypothetical protein n=1 Tax=Aurantibacillus circumpalustris TaxID=3036359 RepID=UPI00295BD244|nr:hypothetical protein [Aurantibacillus circumpalustris]
MLSLYDHLETIITDRDNYRRSNEQRFTNFASQLLEALEVNTTEEIKLALERAFRACNSLHIPFEQNFKRVYIFNGEQLIPDWKITQFASYLIVMNCDPGHELVARAQIYFASH